VKAAAAEFGVDWRLLASLIQAESSSNPNSVNHASGASGLGNIMPGTWAEWAPKVGASDIFNPTDNARVAAAYLARCIKTAGSVRDGLHAYNWGIGRVLDGLEPPAETIEYATKVIFGRDLLKAVGA
jgi:soluble lytic murein transglycosylase-like protein